MIITISGNPGSGKSTAAKSVALSLGAERIYAGGILRSMAKKKGMNLQEFLKYMVDHPEIDKQVDDKVVEDARKFSSEGKHVVVEGRVHFHFLPESFKIFIKVTPEEGALRIYKQMQNKEEAAERNEEQVSLEQTQKDVQERYNSDAERYLKIYGFDYRDEANYDVIIDATEMSIEEENSAVLKIVEKHL